jgi:hypothetical protein
MYEYYLTTAPSQHPIDEVSLLPVPSSVSSTRGLVEPLVQSTPSPQLDRCPHLAAWSRVRQMLISFSHFKTDTISPVILPC